MVTNPSLSLRGTTEVQAADNIVLADFEDTTFARGWVASDDFPYAGPVNLGDLDQTPTPTGFGGNRFVSTFKGDAAKGTLTSPEFIIQKNYIHLSVGGGNHPDDTYVGLFINNERVLSETGADGPALTSRTWNVTAYVGKVAQIRIVDQTAAGWGFIMCDDIVFSDNAHGGTTFAANFSPASSSVLSWTDLSFTVREIDPALPGAFLDVTTVHGVPFTYFEYEGGLYPIVHPGTANAVYYNAAGQAITSFPAKTDALTIEFEGRVYGIHVPDGSSFLKSPAGDLEVVYPDGSTPYVVVSVLPSRTYLAQYNQVARNKPQNTHFEYNYDVAKGQITTTYRFETTNLDTKKAGGETLLTLLPHHYRTTTQNFQFIDATYKTVHGTSKTSAPGVSFTLTYDFGGFPPYLPAPQDLSAAQRTNLKKLIKTNADTSEGYDGNTYAKGLGEKSSIMLQAYALGLEGDADAAADAEKIKNNLKTQLANWLTYDKAETSQYFFTLYPDYGALIGWPCGYGSQGFNDLHFHYGYFIVGGARVSLIDPAFREQYGPMLRLLAQDIANWNHYDPAGAKGPGVGTDTNPFLPFLRNFDSYEGHSYAGGTGDGGGNNQESTSEALNSWWGIYLLGIALNDENLLRLGAVGYKLEITAAGEYWFDLNNDNFPDTYKHEYVGIMRSGALAFATYFSGDPGWVLGIHGVPCDFYYQPYGNNATAMRRVWEAMLKDREADSGTADAYGNIEDMGAYLGGYHLNLLSTFDPETAAGYIDRLYAQGGEWTTHVNIATAFYVTHAYLTYGRPAKGYHTSIASGAVFESAKGEITYLLYNPGTATVNVQVYRDGAVVATVAVGAGEFVNKKA